MKGAIFVVHTKTCICGRGSLQELVASARVRPFDPENFTLFSPTAGGIALRPGRPQAGAVISRLFAPTEVVFSSSVRHTLSLSIMAFSCVTFVAGNFVASRAACRASIVVVGTTLAVVGVALSLVHLPVLKQAIDTTVHGLLQHVKCAAVCAGAAGHVALRPRAPCSEAIDRLLRSAWGQRFSNCGGAGSVAVSTVHVVLGAVEVKHLMSVEREAIVAVPIRHILFVVRAVDPVAVFAAQLRRLRVPAVSLVEVELRTVEAKVEPSVAETVAEIGLPARAISSVAVGARE